MSKEYKKVVYSLIYLEQADQLETENEINSSVRNFEGIKVDTLAVYGVYDIVVKIYGKDDQTIDGYIKNGLRKIKGVEGTLTLMITD